MNALARALAFTALLLGLASLVLHLFVGGPVVADGPSVQLPPDNDRPSADVYNFDRLHVAAAPGSRFTQAAMAAFPGAGVEVAPRTDLANLELYAPLDFRASQEEAGIRLSWVPHPENPLRGVRYGITRWVGGGAAEELAETSRLEVLDPLGCEGLRYRYRLRAILDLEVLDGSQLHRESRTAAASLDVPKRIEWEALGLAGTDGLRLRATRPGMPEIGPADVATGQEVANSGWYLEEWRTRETELPAVTRSPRFDALGRRVIIDGLPADRVREVTLVRQLAMVRLTDPCGTSWSLELLLPEEVPLGGG